MSRNAKRKTPGADKPASDITAAQERNVSYEDFRDFVLSRAYDIISENRFKKWFIRGKDAQDEWALKMQASISLVQTNVRRVSEAVASLSELPGDKIKKICDSVLLMQLPPDDSFMEPGRCMISGLKSYALVNLCPKLLAPDKILISPSLLHFFQVYWFVMKLDYVVRNFTRSWIDDRCGENTIKEICNEFCADDQFTQSAWTVFKHGCSHILQSVSHHEESCKRQEVVATTPPPPPRSKQKGSSRSALPTLDFIQEVQHGATVPSMSPR